MEPQPTRPPPPRLPTIVSPAPVSFLPLCTAQQPSHVAAGSSGTSPPRPAPAPSPGLLHAVCGALLAADTSHLQARRPTQQLVPQPGTLEHALAELNPLVFRSQAGAHHAPQPTVEPQPQKQQKPGRRGGRAAREPAQPASTAASAAAAAAAGGTGVVEESHPAKRRKTSVATNEEYVSRTVDVQQVAATVAEDISSFMQRAAAAAVSSDQGGAAAQEADGDAADEAPAAGSKRPRKSAGKGREAAQQGPCAAVSLDLLKQLQGSLAAGKQAGVLAQLDQEQLRQLLLLLLDHVRLGQDQLLDEQDTAGNASNQAVSTALEAACCCMQVLSAAGMHNSLYIDELMTAAVNLAKYQLQYNVLALHDAQYKRLYRPSSAAAAQDAAPQGKRKGREAAASRPPKALADVRSKLELLLSLLAQVVGRIVLEVELLLPLVRVALSCLTVDSLPVLQAQAVALAVSVFRAFPQQRTSVADEVLTTVLGNVHVTTKAVPRLFETTGAALQPLPVMLASALLVQLVQVSVELPEMDADPASVLVGFNAAYGWSDYLWKGVFSKLPTAKAAKTEGAGDFKLIMQALVADLLTLQMLPEWPAANILLRRFIKHLAGEQGLKHKDVAVKLACVEFTGQLATALCGEALAADREADEMQALKEAAQDQASLQDADGRLQQPAVSDLLVLDHLAASWGCTGGGGGGNSSSSNAGSSSSLALASARHFVCCRMLHDALLSASQEGGGEEEVDPEVVTLLLVQHRKLQDSQLLLLGVGSGLHPSRAQVVGLQRQWVMIRSLAAARVALIKWLLEAGSRQGADASPATVRTKVFKCLGLVVEADSRVMVLPEVAAAVHAAQEDDSPAVKEAVLDLLAKLIATNPELAGEYFDTLVQASYDNGISVRKRAIRALWDCCSCPGFSRADDAVVAVLGRANDREDTMKSLVTKICGEMWFTDASSFAGLGDGEVATASSAAVRTPAIRAAELATVSLRLYEAGGKAIHVPLPPDHGLIVILREVLGTAGSSSAAVPTTKELKELAQLREGAAEVAQALLEMILQQHQQDTADGGLDADSGSAGSFQFLLALHALTSADPTAAAPAADTQRYVRLLAPYTASLASIGAPAQGGRVSSAGAGGANVDDVAKRAAEEGLCLMAVLDTVLRHLGCVEQEVAQQLAAAMVNMLGKQRYPAVIAMGCQLLCTLARMHAPAAVHVTLLANKVFGIAASLLNSGQQTPGSEATLQVGPRMLYMMGQLCRHGADIIDAEAAHNPSTHNCTECLELCVSLWYKRDVPDGPALQRLREGALTAVGLVIIGRPQLMLQPLQLSVLDHQHSAGALATSAHSGGSGDAGSPEHRPQRQLSAQGSGALHGALGQQDSVIKVYTSVLSEHHVPMSVKGRVLGNLVDLLRAEEAAVIARQKEAEAAGTAARLPSTLHPDNKAPLAKVNGENDAAGGSGSSSVIQYVWNNVLSLATGVGGRSSGGGAAGLPPATPVAGAGVMEAAATRRKALELIEVVLRGGLVAPWMAVPPLVAQLTDELPETRATALKVLKGAAEKFPDFVASNLAAGVLEAFDFQSRLWSAKHPGQPLPKGPSAEVLEGLSAMYSDIVHPTQGARQRFLTALLKPFDGACNIAASQTAAAREDPSRLAFCAYVAANLPFKRADEPLVLLHVINSHVSRLAQEVRDVLRRALLRLGLRDAMGLEEEEEDEEPLGPLAAGTPWQQQPAQEAAAAAAAGAGGGSAAEQQGDNMHPPRPQHGSHHHQRQPQLQVSLPLALPLPQWLAAPLKASLGLSMLLVLKQYLMAAYSLSDERVAQYELKGEKARAEAKAVASRSKRTGDFSLGVVNLRAVQDGAGELLAGQYKTFAGLLDNDAANYREVAVLAALQDNADDEEADPAAAGAAAAAAGGGKHPSATPAAATAGLVVYSMDTKPRSSRGRGGGKAGAASTGGARAASTGGKAGGRGSRGRGAAGASTSGRGSKKAKARRRKFDLEDDSEEEAEADSGDEEWGSGRGKKARKLFD